MVRAYMSDRTGRPYIPLSATGINLMGVAEAAVDEARMILRETEPREDRGSVAWERASILRAIRIKAWKDAETRSLFRDTFDATNALADALRAFIGKDGE